MTRQAAQSPADHRFVVAQRGERLQVEQLDAAGLEHRGKVARAVIGCENKWSQRRHLTGLERTPEVCSYSFFFRTVNFSALNSVAKRPLDRRQDSVAAFLVLLAL